MPYQGDTTHISSTHVSSTQATGTPAKTTAHTVTVIPAVDLFLGMVTILAGSGARNFSYPEPQVIARALAQAIRPTQWCEASMTLTVTVAAAGKREGEQRHFALRQGEQA